MARVLCDAIGSILSAPCKCIDATCTKCNQCLNRSCSGFCKCFGECLNKVCFCTDVSETLAVAVRE